VNDIILIELCLPSFTVINFFCWSWLLQWRSLTAMKVVLCLPAQLSLPLMALAYKWVYAKVYIIRVHIIMSYYSVSI